MPGGVRPLVGLYMLLIVLVLPAGAQAAPIIGVGEQQAAAYEDPLFADLGVRNVRLNVAWDALDTDWQEAELTAALSSIQQRQLVPLVVFSQSRTAGRTRVLPSAAQFRRTVSAFRTRWPWINEYGAWNEANSCGQPSCKNPSRVAGYYKELRKQCPGCRVLAATLVDMPSMVPYAKKLSKLAGRPKLWGLQNYIDVNYLRDDNTRALLEAVDGEVWLTEVGGMVVHRGPGLLAHKFPRGEGRADKVMRYVLYDLLPRFPRLTRSYFYQWRASAEATWDTGLLNPGGRPRKAYRTLLSFQEGDDEVARSVGRRDRQARERQERRAQARERRQERKDQRTAEDRPPRSRKRGART